MKILNKSYCVLLLIYLVQSCDPGHSGFTTLSNQTAYSLELKYTIHTSDTTIIIQPFTEVEVYKFGGLGAGRDYNCCPCEFNEISLTAQDTTKTIIKLVNETSNWNMVNQNQKKFDSEKIQCTFLLEPNDIQ